MFKIIKKEHCRGTVAHPGNKFLETYVNKQGEEKEKIVDVWYFNQNEYEKFFNNIFYPAQEEYLKVLQEQLQNRVKLSGTIFG